MHTSSPALRKALGKSPSCGHTRMIRQRSRSSCSARRMALRSEEHTSELQSRRDLVCRLLLEKKKKKKKIPIKTNNTYNQSQQTIPTKLKLKLTSSHKSRHTSSK